MGSTGTDRVPPDEDTKLRLERDRLYVWAWDVDRNEMRQLLITRICALVDGQTGRVIPAVDIARWIGDAGECGSLN